MNQYFLSPHPFGNLVDYKFLLIVLWNYCASRVVAKHNCAGNVKNNLKQGHCSVFSWLVRAWWPACTKEHWCKDKTLSPPG
ncbi:MAG: hypothetical protein B6I36_10075 [Desulfobacteraceae bacterium 4572_35.1]|nr:MAG: hypothetical protein B6I36_10075 [Desulfobacteraceae bacterium 4572_35.1]